MTIDSALKRVLTTNTDYIAISIEPSSKRSFRRYALLPASFTADLITSPLQLIGYGLLAFATWGMKF